MVRRRAARPRAAAPGATGWRPAPLWAMLAAAPAPARRAEPEETIVRLRRRPAFRPASRPALRPALLAGLLLAAGCGGGEPRGRVETIPDPGLVFLQEPDPRRASCVPVAETELTRPYMAPGAALVACRSGHGAGFALVAGQGARQVARTQNYTLYAVPAGSGG
jgi:hypothetical protein